MSENTQTHRIRADVSARVEYHTHIEIEVSEQATEEEIQRELVAAAQGVVEENLQTYQGLEPEITITRRDEEEEGKRKPEQGLRYRYQVEVSTHQLLHQTLAIVSQTPLSQEQVSERAIKEAQKGAWTPGALDQRIEIVELWAEF